MVDVLVSFFRSFFVCIFMEAGNLVSSSNCRPITVHNQSASPHHQDVPANCFLSRSSTFWTCLGPKGSRRWHNLCRCKTLCISICYLSITWCFLKLVRFLESLFLVIRKVSL